MVHENLHWLVKWWAVEQLIDDVRTIKVVAISNIVMKNNSYHEEQIKHEQVYTIKKMVLRLFHSWLGSSL